LGKHRGPSSTTITFDNTLLSIILYALA
jgi:hypothetical protein